MESLCKTIIIMMESSEFNCLMTLYKQRPGLMVLNFQFKIFFLFFLITAEYKLQIHILLKIDRN